MNKKSLTAVMIAFIAIIAVIAGTTLSVWAYKGRDKRALAQAAAGLRDDLALWSADSVPPEEVLAVSDLLLYGDTHITYSGNVKGIDVTNFIPYDLPIDTEGITIGFDADIDRSCADERMEASGSVSVMNYELSGIEAHVTGSKMSVSVPELLSEDIVLDTGIDLFPGASTGDNKSLTGVTGDMLKLSEVSADALAGADVKRDKEDETLYHVIIGREDVQALLDVSYGSEAPAVSSDIAIDLYLDDNMKIRRIDMPDEVVIDGSTYLADISFDGEEVPADDITIRMTAPYAFDLHLTRTAEGIDTEFAKDNVRLQGLIDVKPSKNSDGIAVTYSGLRAVEDGKTFFISSGRAVIASSSNSK